MNGLLQLIVTNKPLMPTVYARMPVSCNNMFAFRRVFLLEHIDGTSTFASILRQLENCREPYCNDA